MKTVLLVEDDPVDVCAVRRILERTKLPLHLVSAEDGMQALGWLARQPVLPRCVLLDLNMPRMNGHEFLAHVRANPRMRSLPVYIVTTSTRSVDLDACRQSGFARYIVKSTRLELFAVDMATLLHEVSEDRPAA